MHRHHNLPRNRLLFSTWSGAFAVVLLQACAHTQAPPPTDFTTIAQRLQSISEFGAGERSLAALDVNGDGRIDGADAQVFADLAQRAETLAQQAGIALAPRENLYEGPKADAPGVFALLQVGHDGIDLADVPAERLLELVVEARWLSRQTAAVSHPLALELGDEHPVLGGLLRQQLPGYNPESMAPKALCAALESLEVGSLMPAEQGVTAIFDLDSTVWAGNVMDPFLAAVVRSELPKAAANQGLQAFLKSQKGVDAALVEANDAQANARLLLERYTDKTLSKEERISDKDMFYTIALLLAGSTVAEVAEVSRQAYISGGVPFGPWQEEIFAEPTSGCGMRRVIALLQERGIGVYLLSATHDPVAQAAAEILGVPADNILGSLLALENGVYTGEVAASTYYSKGAIVRQWLPGPPFLAFGDSPFSDFSMLQEALGPAFMINPRPEFLQRDTQEAQGRFVTLEFEFTEATAAPSSEVVPRP